ncbi:MAG: hypothetical protein JW855_00025 [Gammaproteobacteria bacterium]|nr:hypothetical protein [Gammaproteobacteria bacterium]
MTKKELINYLYNRCYQTILMEPGTQMLFLQLLEIIITEFSVITDPEKQDLLRRLQTLQTRILQNPRLWDSILIKSGQLKKILKILFKSELDAYTELLGWLNPQAGCSFPPESVLREQGCDEEGSSPSIQRANLASVSAIQGLLFDILRQGRQAGDLDSDLDSIETLKRQDIERDEVPEVRMKVNGISLFSVTKASMEGTAIALEDLLRRALGEEFSVISFLGEHAGVGAYIIYFNGDDSALLPYFEQERIPYQKTKENELIIRPQDASNLEEKLKEFIAPAPIPAASGLETEASSENDSPPPAVESPGRPIPVDINPSQPDTDGGQQGERVDINEIVKEMTADLYPIKTKSMTKRGIVLVFKNPEDGCGFYNDMNSMGFEVERKTDLCYFVRYNHEPQSDLNFHSQRGLTGSAAFFQPKPGEGSEGDAPHNRPQAV